MAKKIKLAFIVFNPALKEAALHFGITKARQHVRSLHRDGFKDAFFRTYEPVKEV